MNFKKLIAGGLLVSTMIASTSLSALASEKAECAPERNSIMSLHSDDAQNICLLGSRLHVIVEYKNHYGRDKIVINRNRYFNYNEFYSHGAYLESGQLYMTMDDFKDFLMDHAIPFY